MGKRKKVREGVEEMKVGKEVGEREVGREDG